jgi:hypothetical protein
VDGADLHGAVVDQLRDPDALGTGIGQVQLGCNAAFEQVQVFGAGHRRDEQPVG